MNSVEKTVTILKILGEKPYVYGVTELGEMIGCGKSGTYKILSVLVKEGFVAQTREHKYTLGITNYLLGQKYEQNVGILHFIRPFMKELRDITGETVTFGMFINGVPTSVSRKEGTQIVRVMENLGGNRPLNAGAIGQMLGAQLTREEILENLEKNPPLAYTDITKTNPEDIIANLAKIKEQGYVISDGDFSLDTISFGAPIMDSSGKVWATVALSAPRIRVTDELKKDYLQKVLYTADSISKAIA